MHHAHRLAQVLQQAADEVLRLQPAAGATVATDDSSPVTAPAIVAVGRVEHLMMLATIAHRQPPASLHATAIAGGWEPIPAVAWGEAMVVLPLQEGLSQSVDHCRSRRLAEVWMLLRKSVNLWQRMLLAGGHGG